MPPQNQLLNRQARPTSPPPDFIHVIFSNDNGGEQRRRHIKFHQHSVIPTKYVDENYLLTLGLLNNVRWLLDNTSLYRLCTQSFPTYEPIVLEFLSSFFYESPPGEPFNHEHALAEMLHFTRGENVKYQPHVDEMPWEVVRFNLWRSLTGEVNND